MKWTFLLALSARAALPQEAAKPDLLKLTDDVKAAVEARNWRQAAELSHSLNTAVRDERNRSMAAEGTKLTDAIIGWLPADTETLAVATQPFRIVEPAPGDVESALASAQGYVVGLLAAAEGEKLEKTLLGRTVAIAALAARSFAEQAPYDNGIIPLGLIAYQGCSVYAFAQPVSESILSRNADELLMGQRVWISKGTQNDRPDSDTYFVSIPKPDTILVCNDRSFLTEMIARILAPKKTRALPANLPEWKLLDRSAPLWAIRHFRGERADVDPSQPAHLLSDDKDPEATGMVLHFGLASAAARALMFAKSDPWHQVAQDDDLQGAAQSRKVADGLWELSVADKPAAGSMAAFVLMGLLGFAIYL